MESQWRAAVETYGERHRCAFIDSLALWLSGNDGLGCSFRNNSCDGQVVDELLGVFTAGAPAEAELAGQWLEVWQYKLVVKFLPFVRDIQRAI
ncbi:MAG: hypothetical protein ACP5MD_16535, partial [Verrucomicrobiia bacterium]